MATFHNFSFSFFLGQFPKCIVCEMIVSGFFFVHPLKETTFSFLSECFHCISDYFKLYRSPSICFLISAFIHSLSLSVCHLFFMFHFLCRLFLFYCFFFLTFFFLYCSSKSFLYLLLFFFFFFLFLS